MPAELRNLIARWRPWGRGHTLGLLANASACARLTAWWIEKALRLQVIMQTQHRRTAAFIVSTAIAKPGPVHLGKRLLDGNHAGVCGVLRCFIFIVENVGGSRVLRPLSLAHACCCLLLYWVLMCCVSAFLSRINCCCTSLGCCALLLLRAGTATVLQSPRVLAVYASSQLYRRVLLATAERSAQFSST